MPICFIKGKRVRIFNCFKCRLGRISNSSDGLITFSGEDFSDSYLPAKTIGYVEIEMTKEREVIEGDINLVADDGKPIKRGRLRGILEFQYDQIKPSIIAINLEWDYRECEGKDRIILNMFAGGKGYGLISDNQINLELHIVRYTIDAVTIRILHEQKELFAENKKIEGNQQINKDVEDKKQ